MMLPQFLESDDLGFIHLAGHRIGLHHVIRVYLQGSSAESIAAHFPSLSLALIHKVIAFYLDNQSEIDSYIAAHDQDIAMQVATTPAAPSIIELRKRLQDSAAVSSLG